MTLAQRRRRDAAPLVVGLERAARTQVEDAHAALRGAEELGGLARRVAEHVAQEEHRALPRAERLERDEERVGGALGKAVAGLRVRRVARVEVQPLPVRRLDRGRQPRTHVGPPSPPAERVDAEVRGHAREPRPELLDADVRRSGDEARERLLHDVVGVLRAPGEAVGQPPEPPLLRAEQLRERCVPIGRPGRGHAPPSRPENAGGPRDVTGAVPARLAQAPGAARGRTRAGGATLAPPREVAMQSLFRESDAPGDLLELRAYTSRLLGREPSLVLHGGGNTSVKLRVPDFYGDEADVLYVKGSGSDLASHRARAASRRCASPPSSAWPSSTPSSDADMVREQRAALLDPGAPDPSIEAILHALVPLRFVDHTHADAVVTLSNTPDGEDAPARALRRARARPPLRDARLRARARGLEADARRRTSGRSTAWCSSTTASSPSPTTRARATSG